MKPPTLQSAASTAAMFGETFKVEVGLGPFTEDANLFVLHKGIAEFYSGFFRAALQKDAFKEGIEKCVKLPTDKARTFKDLVGWIYTRTYSVTENLGRAVELWIMADRYEVPLLANYIISQIHNEVVSTTSLNVDCIPFIYENTAPSSHLRRYFITMTAAYSTPKSPFIINIKPKLSEEALWDLYEASYSHAKWSVDGISKKLLKEWDACEFHFHEEGEKCPKA